MPKRSALPALLLLAVLAGGCGHKDNTPAGDAPQPLNIPAQNADQGVALGPDNLQAEIDKTGAGVKLAMLDLSPAGLALTMDAPEGARVVKEVVSGRREDVHVLAGAHFALKFVLGKAPLQRRKRELARQKLPINGKALVLAESTLQGAGRCQFGKCVVAGHQDIYVENIDAVDGNLVNHSQADCLLMLKCIGTLAPKTPPPSDPVSALQQLKAALVKGADGQVMSVRLDPRQTTDATLSLLAKVPGIERLDAGDSQVTDDGLAHLAALTGLKELCLRGCPFTDVGLSHLAGLTNLESLNLASLYGDSPLIRGPGLAALAGLPKLRVLVLDQTLVDDAGLAHLKNARSLKELYLEQTKVTGPGMSHLNELAGLTLLSLNDTKVNDAGLEGLKGLTGLQVLNLRGTLVGGDGLKHLQGMKKLGSLTLSGTLLTDEGLKNLQGMAGLENLFLGGTRVSDSGMTHLQGLSGLKQLALDETAVSDAGLEHLPALKGLQKVTLAGTRVSRAGLDKLKGALPQASVSD